MKIHNTLLIGLLSLLITSSCVSRKKIAYFQDLQEIHQRNTDNNIRIKPDDVLTIRVSAPEQEAALPFNLTKSVMGMASGAGGGGGANVELETYLVADDGSVKFPVLGSIEAAGLTNLEFAAKLEKELRRYVEDPLVNVRIMNFQISILGEVGSPGTFPIEDDHISLPQALGLAGDVLLTGKRKEILVMREEDGYNTHAYLDLTDADVIDSPYYNLRQNDVVYVEPIGPRIQSASYLGIASSYLSIASVLVSLVLIFTR